MYPTLSNYLTICLSVYHCLSIFLSFQLAIYLSICLSVFLSICLSMWSERDVFFTFCLRNVLRARTACTLWTSQLPKRFERGVFSHFDFYMCFASQRCALFRHLNFQQWSERGVFSHFDFDVCFAPQRALFRHLNWLPKAVLVSHFDFEMRRPAFAFSTTQLQSGRHWGVFTILASKCASRPQRRAFFDRSSRDHGSAPATLANLLFNPPQPQNIGTTQRFTIFHDFSTFSSP